jgi:hypothetical protein
VKRADVKAVDRDGWILLYNVAQAGRETLFGSLPRRVKNVVAVDNDGRTPLHHTAQVSLGDAIWALVAGVIQLIKADTRHDAVQAGSIAAIQELGS